MVVRRVNLRYVNMNFSTLLLLVSIVSVKLGVIHDVQPLFLIPQMQMTTSSFPLLKYP